MLRQAAIATAAILALSGSLIAAEISDGPIKAREVAEDTYLTFEVQGWPKDVRGVMFRITGPKEYFAEKGFGKSVPKVDLAKLGDLADGVYSYEIRGGTNKTVKKADALDNGRGKDDVAVDYMTFLLAGSLVIKNGAIVTFASTPEKGSEKPVIDDKEDPDTDSGKPGEVGDGEPGKGEEKPVDGDG